MPPRKKKTEDATPVRTHQHADHQRPVIPDAGVTSGEMPKAKRSNYAYNPHLDPVLRFDPKGLADRVLSIVGKVEQGISINDEEKRILRSVARAYEKPWLEWAGKREDEGGDFSIDDVILHIHERISPQAIINAVRRDEEHQADLFAKPSSERESDLQFYRHTMGWTNRLVLGDSLQVMNSLVSKEGMRGKVQMIYMDPPYGINYSSNWQNTTGSFIVKDLSSELEAIKAYRDTWKLGVHSYLSYLKKRLIVARELLAETGSIFVQISDDHEHRVRALLDEVFGDNNFCALIPFRKKTMPLGASGIEQMDDFILWYYRDAEKAKVNKLFVEMTGEGDWHYQYLEDSVGGVTELSDEQINNHRLLPHNGGLYMLKSLQPSGEMKSGMFNFSYMGREWAHPAKGYCTTQLGMQRLAAAGRLGIDGNRLAYKLFVSDSGASALTSPWQDTIGPRDKRYVVQTSNEVVKRCMLLTTNPGDLVLDPTCGSGTTAHVAEHWGRRWITMDSSRVAISIARQRILTATYPIYKTKDYDASVGIVSSINPAKGFVLRQSNRVTLGSIANNEAIDPVVARYAGELHSLRERLDALPVHLRKQIKHIDENSIITEERTSSEIAEIVREYRQSLESKRRDISDLIKRNTKSIEWVDRPEVISGGLRVSGPFSVEGVRPEELVLGEDGRVFDPTVNEEDGVSASSISGYVDRMVSLLKMDGVTFLGNRPMKFDALEHAQIDGIHALGAYRGAEPGELPIAVAFGPQYGPVNAIMTSQAIEAARKQPGVSELVIAGFSFDAAAQQKAREASESGMQVHIAHIRPDVSPGMEGLLKDQRNSQLFTVFGQPEFKAKSVGAGEYQVELGGVCVYNPLTGMVESSNASKVAAWFLDSDYDGQCFCVSQAFFPDSKAWEKIAKALGSKEDEAAFEAFAGTISLPFKLGQHRRVAIKVIDPRGNEVMGIKTIA